MFKKFTNGCVNVMNKYLPDAFLFALILTFVVFFSGVLATSQSPLAMVNHWYGGFWNLLSFSMQMAMVVVTGNAMAQAPVIKKSLTNLAISAKTPKRAILITAFVSVVACWLNWGFGLVVGALIAREMAKNVKGCDYRLLIATAYSGFVVWHGGLSASIPLTLASGSDLSAVTGGVITEAIPISQTIFSPLNLIISAMFIIGLPFIMLAMKPNDADVIEVDPELLVDRVITEKPATVFADNVERSKFIWGITLVLGFSAITSYFITKGFNLDLNIVNLIFMFTGILLHGNLRRYIDAVSIATGNASGILLQFPFYAGIMGMMTGANAEGTSLAILLSQMFVNLSNEVTFPLFTFLSAGIVNFFVPSGGGQWAVQGPIMMPAGQSLGVDPAITALAISWGDAWTNMIQPFWALPALAIAKLSARDIMGYCVIVLIVGGFFVCGSFLVYGLLF